MLAGNFVGAVVDLDAESGAWFVVEFLDGAQLAHGGAGVPGGELRIVTARVDEGGALVGDGPLLVDDNLVAALAQHEGGGQAEDTGADDAYAHGQIETEKSLAL